jgi:hypothetical protein
MKVKLIIHKYYSIVSQSSCVDVVSAFCIISFSPLNNFAGFK